MRLYRLFLCARNRNYRILWYIAALVICGLEILIAFVRKWEMFNFLTYGLTFVIPAVVFGEWFTFGVKEKRPAFYDEYNVKALVDGFFRMNVPGVNFNNRNWPHIVKTGWLWSVLMLWR